MVDLGESPSEWENEFVEEDEHDKWIVKQNIMFLIDASKPMFDTFENKTFFSTSIEICKAVVMKLIRKSRNDKIGVMLFGTNDNNKTYPNFINILSEMRKPNIDTIKILDDVMLSDITRYGQSQLSPLADALWYSNYHIKKNNENQSCSSIILMTCNDQPIIGDSKKQFNLRKRLDDVIKNDIDFKLIPIGATFNMKLFYGNILSNINNIIIPTNGLENIDDIMSELDEKLKHGRSVSKIKFFIDDTNYISTSLFNFYTRSKIPAKVRLDKKTNKPLTSMNQMFMFETNELMYKSDMAKYCVIKQKNVVFRNEDISVLKSNIMEPGTIRLLGFTNKENIYITHHFKTSSFIQPNNEIIEGSSLFFNTLLGCCLEMNKIIMCFLKIRQGGRGHLTALVPQDEVLDEHGTQKYPPGFHVIYLPFTDCIRTVEFPKYSDGLTSTDKHVNMFKGVCEKLAFDYYPALIKNPKINFHWAMLEALALELKAPNISDETLTANGNIDDKLSALKDGICEEFSSLQINENEPTDGKKRTANTNNRKTAAKKKKN